MNRPKFEVGMLVRDASRRTPMRINERLPECESSRRLGAGFYRLEDGTVWHETALEQVVP